jgi:hypothetical protein
MGGAGGMHMSPATGVTAERFRLGLLATSNDFQAADAAIIGMIATSGVDASLTGRVQSLESGVLGLSNRTASLESGVLSLTNAMDSITNRTASLESGVLGLTNSVNAATNRIAAIEANTSRWEQAYIYATNWAASAAYGITSTMVANWNSATSWLSSVAYAITASDTNNWTTAWSWGNHGAAGYVTYSMTGNLNAASHDITNLQLLQGTGNVQLVRDGGCTISTSSTHGNIQLGASVGDMGISNNVAGAIQQGSCGGVMSINTGANGACQAGTAMGRMVIGSGALGARQYGYVPSGAAATNRGVGAVQLLDLTTGQRAETTTGGDGSLLLGAGTNSHRYAIVAGDGQTSHGDGSITAGGGFYGAGTGLTAIPGANVSGTVPSAAFATSAGTAAIATGLVDNATITVAPPTASNSPVDYATFSSALVGNFVSFFTTNQVNAGTNAMLPTVPSASSVTSVQVTAVGQYYITWHATNRTFRQLQGGAAEVELWTCENTAGSLTHKPELYIFDTTTSNLVEFGETVASQTVAAGSVLTKQTFSVPYGAFATNVDCQFEIRLKVTGISGSPTVRIGCGGTTPSHFSIDVPNSSLVPDNAQNAYSLGGIPAAQYPTNGSSGVRFTGTLTPTNSLTVTNALQLVGISGATITNIIIQSTNNTRIATNWIVQTVIPTSTVAAATALAPGANSNTLAAAVTNGGATVNGQAVSNGAVIAISSLTPGAGSNTLAAAVTNLPGGYFDAYKTAFYVTNYSSSTVTIARAWGDSIVISLPANKTLTFDPAEWPTNSMGCIGVSLHPNGYSTTFDPSMISTNSATNTVPGSAGLAVQTNAWNLLVFAKGWGWTNLAVHDR